MSNSARSRLLSLLMLLLATAGVASPALAVTVSETLDRNTIEAPSANCPQGGSAIARLPAGPFSTRTTRVILRLEDTAFAKRGTSWGYNVSFTVTPTTVTGVATGAPIATSLSILRGMDREAFEAVAVLTPWTARAAVLCITGVNGPDLSAVPPNVIIALSIEGTRAVAFDTVAKPVAVLASDRVTLTNVPAAANAYEFEWSYADRYDRTGAPPRDSVRTRSAVPSFALDLAYPAGTLAVRGRALSVNTSGTNAVGSWSDPLQILVDPACGNRSPCIAPVDPALNWRYLGSYSQNSAALSTYTVFDAVLRSRQTQQRLRSQVERLITEAQFDREGRARLQMLPAPLSGEQYGYAPTFNAVATGNAPAPYDFEAFDGVVPPPVSNDRGAGRYYSANAGPSTNAYTPDAEGYPFSASEPVRDSSGRLRRAGANGAALALGQGHESRFRYGTAESSTLRRLFGKNVGRAAYYQRTLQIDPNGQAHVAYVDRAGNPVATALAGDTPTNLDAIDRPAPTWLTHSLNENNSIDVRAGTSRSVNTIATTATSNLFFTYAVKGVEYSTPADGGFPAVCESCRYRLRIRITDPQGNAVPLCRGVTRGAGADCSCAGASSDEIVQEIGNTAPEPAFCSANGDDARTMPTTAGSPVQFCAKLPEGEFEVVKELEVLNDTLEQKLTQVTSSTNFESTNAPRPETTDAGRVCGTSCESFCEEATHDPTRTTLAYGTCVQTCRNPTQWAFNASAEQSCRSLEAQLKADLAPGGLYAGRTQHPEQCHVAVCKLRNDPAHNSDAFDDRMMSVPRYVEALCRGYLDPLQGTPGAPPLPAACGAIPQDRDPAFEPGGYGVPVRSWVDAALRDYAGRMPGFSQPGPPALASKNIWALAAEPLMYADAANPNGRTPSLDEQWRLFRSLYFGAKQTALTRLTEQRGCPYLNSSVARVKRPGAFNSVTEILNELTRRQGELCGSLCSMQVSRWMDDLGQSCPTLGSGARRGIRSDLGAYCRSTCGPSNPLATITSRAVANDVNLRSAATRLPAGCTLDVLKTKRPFTLTRVCRPDATSSPPTAASSAQGNRDWMLSVVGPGHPLSPAARSFFAEPCHTVVTGVDPSHVIPPGPTPTDRLNLCTANTDDLATQQQILLLANAKLSFITRAREINHERCLGTKFVESFGYEAAPNEYQYTLRYYDQAGDLVQTVPPKGLRPLSSQQLAQLEDSNTANDPAPPAHELVSRYQYDSRGQVVRRKAPDSGETHFWHNRAGQLRFSQTSQQALDRRYAYMKYDARGRLIESGLVAGWPDVAYIVALGATLGLNISAADAREFLERWLRAAANLPPMPIAGSAITTEEVVTTSYDRPSSSCGSLVAENLRGRVAAMTAKTSLGDVTTCYTYDAHGSVTSLLQRIPQLGDKRVDYDYDILDGKILATHYQAGTTEALHHRYSYDDDRRLVAVETSRDGELWERDARYSYYRHGPLARIELGDDSVQGLDYLYSTNGWPKGVNSDSLDATRDPGRDGHNVGSNTTVARDVFGSAVHYFPGDYAPAGLAGQSQTAQPQLRAATKAGTATILSALALAGCMNAASPDLCGLYNGNAASAVHSVSGFTSPVRGTAYRYDQLNRLRTADSFASADVTANEWPTSPPTAAARSPWRTALEYDANGNITHLDRTAADPTGAVASGVAMDELTYRYPATSNRLLHINDAVQANRFTDDLDDQGPFTPGGPTNYSYDADGRLTRDGRAGLNGIQWTSGNRVRSIDRTDDTIEFVYDGLGHRIAKITRAGLNPSEWHYELFVRDEKGEILATYRKDPPPIGQTESRAVLLDQTLQGAQRLGILKPALATTGPIVLGGAPASPPIGIIVGGPPQPQLTRHARVRGAKQYELANHLGNVYATISDRKQEIVDAATQTVTHYEAEIVNRDDYDPFGSLLPGRNQETAPYRYGFSGLERDDELKGGGNSYYTAARLFDPRVGRWLSPDAIDVPDSSPFVGFANNPLRHSDPAGTDVSDAIKQKQQALAALSSSDAASVANKAVWSAQQDRYAGLTQESESAWRSIDFGDWWYKTVEKPVVKVLTIGVRWTAGVVDPTGIVESKLDEADEIHQYDTSAGREIRLVLGVAAGHVNWAGAAREALAVESAVLREEVALERAALREEAALERAAADEAFSMAPCPRGMGGSFDPDTLVQTDHGSVPIRAVRVGDLVLSGDEATGTTEWRRVSDVIGRTHASFVRLVTIADDGTRSELKTTDEHPFWVEGKGWTPAGEIQAPARIRTAQGWANLDSAETIAEAVATLNLTVDGLNTFFVGDDQVWAHNCIQANAAAGRAREKLVTAQKQKQYPAASVQRELYLRDSAGNIVRDKVTGEARRVDIAAFEQGKVREVTEVTSKTADKTAQFAKEKRIRGQGGTYLRNRDTGNLVDASKKKTNLERRP